MPQLDLIPEETSHERDEKERQLWLERLRMCLQDPEFRKTPGFPSASDDAILALSDPPYYTACPNPFLSEFLENWERERPQSSEGGYHRDPFASDVSEGKSDSIYNAHSYHTKVPHKAIMRYILHYTDPGDIVLDGFCGTGMTGIAAEMCGEQKTVESLGYSVDDDGIIWNGDNAISRLGPRRTVLIDLSPAATFITSNYTASVNAKAFEREAKRILGEVEQECGWMYETIHIDGKSKGRINYTIWSDVFLCPSCGAEMVFWDVAIDHENGSVRDDWDCPSCHTYLSKSPGKKSRALRVERAFETKYDRAIGRSIRQAKLMPVVINYSVGKKKFDKRPESSDLSLIAQIEENDIAHPFPAVPMMFKGENWGDTWRAGVHSGLTHVHHFYTYRNLWVLAAVRKKILESPFRNPLLFWFTAAMRTGTKLTSIKFSNFFFGGAGPITPGIKGTLYVSSAIPEVPITKIFSDRLKAIVTSFSQSNKTGISTLTSTQSSTSLQLPSNSLDYIFVDPPFGGNISYSELNFLWESWLEVFTQNDTEAVVSKTQRKGLADYQDLMEECFCQAYRVLKPGRWLTIEFHNSQNSVWNSILEALLRAGFMIADVRTLDKKQGTFKQVTSSGAVKQDLVISAYKSDSEFEQRFVIENGSVRGAWEFISQHLEHVAPPILTKNNLIEFIEERAQYLLYDRMVAYHIQRGLSVPLSASQFYQGLKERFAERDGMIFTYPQVAAYDRMRLQAERVEQLPLFIIDEKSAIQWLRRQLDPAQGNGPQTYAELANKFKKELHQVSYETMPELRDILDENFLKDDSEHWYLPDPARESDMQSLREKSLLREFVLYIKGRGKLKSFRLEAVRAGFSRAWKDRDYTTIVQVADRLPARVFEDDPQLMMYADNARLRADAQPKQEQLFKP